MPKKRIKVRVWSYGFIDYEGMSKKDALRTARESPHGCVSVGSDGTCTYTRTGEWHVDLAQDTKPKPKSKADG